MSGRYPMAKLDLSVGSPVFMLLSTFVRLGELILSKASPGKVQEYADELLDGWVRWQRVLNRWSEKLLDSLDGKEGE